MLLMLLMVSQQQLCINASTHRLPSLPPQQGSRLALVCLKGSWLVLIISLFFLPHSLIRMTLND